MIPLEKLFFKMLHSLTGLYLVAFLFFHLYSNAFAHLGKEAYDKMAYTMVNRPYLNIMEMALILLPLAFHGLYGLYQIYRGSDNLIRQKYLINALYTSQRWTGVLLLVFLIFHVVLFRVNRSTPAITFADLSAILQSNWVFVVTLGGCLITALHITGGLWNVGINWGILKGPVSQKGVLTILAGMGLLVFLWAWDIIRAFVAL